VDVGSAQDGDVCAMANIVGRMVQPGSERRTNAWLRYASALGEMLGYRDAIERQLCGAFMEKAISGDLTGSGTIRPISPCLV